MVEKWRWGFLGAQKHEDLTYLTFLNLPRIQLATAIVLCLYVFIQYLSVMDYYDTFNFYKIWTLRCIYHFLQLLPL
jgi:hypothetical protein